MRKKLYRSNLNRVLFGVCGGLGDYFQIDPIIFRLAFAIFSLMGGGVLAYFLCALCIPQDPD